MYVDIGQYLFHIGTVPNIVEKNLLTLYENSVSKTASRPADYSISLKFETVIRRFIKPQVTFCLGNEQPFKPLPVAQSYPVLEWGMNWCIAATDFNHLIIHAAVLVKNGKAIVFPATPGSGKSTLSAYFALSGWQLYSDEMAIIDTKTLKVKPLFRPICLKNQSIPLVKSWFPEAIFTGTAHDTQKGDVAHLKVCDWNEYKTFQEVEIVAIIYPKYQESVKEIQPYIINKVEGFEKLISNSFNYNILGKTAFECTQKLIENTTQAEITYSELSEASDILLSEFIK
jgi:HprK-related kinase A